MVLIVNKNGFSMTHGLVYLQSKKKKDLRWKGEEYLKYHFNLMAVRFKTKTNLFLTLYKGDFDLKSLQKLIIESFINLNYKTDKMLY